MSDRIPSFFMLVPGPWTSSADVADVLTSAQVEVAADEPIAGTVLVDVVEDEHLAAAFAYGREGPLPDDLVEKVGRHRHAALIECGWNLLEATEKTAAIGQALCDAGGAAVRMEGSGNACDWEKWMRRMTSAHLDDLYANAVVIASDDDGTLFTCGMHQFGLPDAQLRLPRPDDAVVWLDALCVFMLAEKPVLGSGHTFRPHDDVERRRLERWPDHRHHLDDGRHNPFGLWRLVDDDDKALQGMRDVPVIMPSLFALLQVMEQKKGAPLTADEVDELVDNAPAVLMSQEDANTLEASRGYADLEPRRAWAQWQLVREG